MNIESNYHELNYLKENAKKFIRDKKNKKDIESFLNYLKDNISSINENSQEAEVETFLVNLFNKLEYSVKQQGNYKIEGSKEIPDMLLFANKQDKDYFEKETDKSRKNQTHYLPTEKILSILEVKKISIKILKVKENENQLYNYLGKMKVDYGVLTNGYEFIFYDKSKAYTGDKKYIKFNIKNIINETSNINEDSEFLLFYYLIRRERYINDGKEIKKEDKEFAEKIKKTLREILYEKPRESIIFKVSKSIHNKSFSSNSNINISDLNEILEQSIIFILRLFFIVYLEDKFKETLDQHNGYSNYISFRHHLYPELKKGKIKNGYKKLISIFKALDEGNDTFNFPMFNGGLFDSKKNEYLNNENLLSNEDLKKILLQLLFFGDEENEENNRYINYSIIDVKSFGELYESLLEYDLRIAEDEVYEVEDSKGIVYYYNLHDLPHKYHNKCHVYNKGDIYLTSMSQERKKSGAFYTPDNLTKFMVKSAIEEQLQKGKSPFDIKIIDNSCGSGHFLIECLDYLTYKIYKDINLYKTIKSELNKECEIINKELEKYKSPRVEKEDVLKRMLLKKCIYGVDINPISIEVTKLSLWIHTFIFGTPLSFIEHHIKVGDALIGYSRKDDFMNSIAEYISEDNTLFEDEINSVTKKIENAYDNIKEINDTNKDNIKKSKDIYIKYKKDIYNLIICSYLIKLYEFSKLKILDLKDLKEDLSSGFSLSKLFKEILNNSNLESNNENLSKKINLINKLGEKYKIFNYAIEFPDVEKGFDIVIGNPPWEKVIFNEKDFFSKYIPNWRNLPNSQKRVNKEKLMGSNKNSGNENLIKDYSETKELITNLNKIYKIRFKEFSNGGQPDLYRYFIASNLKLINKGGNLTYLIPFSIFSEDSSKKLRKEIFYKYNLKYIYQFENKGRFESVHPSLIFAAFQIIDSENTLKHFNAKFMIQKEDKFLERMTEDLKEDNELQNLYLHYDLSLIKQLSPDYNIIFKFESYKQIKLIKKFFSKFKLIEKDYITIKDGLNKTTFRDYFIEENDKEDLIFLYQGGNIYQFNSRFFEDSSYKEKKKMIWIERFNLEKRKKNLNYYDSNIVYRRVASSTNERTMIAALIPKNAFCTNSLMIVITDSIYKKIFIIGIFNSLVFDFMIRRIVNTNLLQYIVYSCAMPQPEESEIIDNPLYFKLARNTCILVVKNDKENFKDLLELEAFKFKEEEKNKIMNFNKDDKFFIQIEEEINFIVAEIYELEGEEFKLILEDFEALKNKKGRLTYIQNLSEGYKKYINNKNNKIETK